MMITDYGYCNYVKKLQYSKYIVHQLKDIVTLRPQCMLICSLGLTPKESTSSSLVICL